MLFVFLLCIISNWPWIRAGHYDCVKKDRVPQRKRLKPLPSSRNPKILNISASNEFTLTFLGNNSQSFLEKVFNVKVPHIGMNLSHI